MESILGAQFEIIESLPSFVGEFAPAAYKARETPYGEAALGRVVLLRLLPPEADTASVRQASDKCAAILPHPNILTHYGLTEVRSGDEMPHGLYAVSEYSRGISLRERVRRVAPFSTAVTVDIAISIIQALIRAESEGINHGDLRPEEILLTPEGQVKVADFVLGRVIRQATGETVSDDNPAQSVSRLLFEMLTAQSPLAGQMPVAREFNSSVPPAISGIIQKASIPEGYSALPALLADLQSAREDIRTGKPLTWTPLTAQRPSSTVPKEPLRRAPDETVKEERTMAGAAGAKTPRGRRTEPSEDYDDYPEPPSAGRAWLRRLLMGIALIAVLCVIFVCAYFAMMLTGVPKDITVPNLIGKQFADAQKIAEQEHFDLIQLGHDYSDTWPEGAIYNETPTAGRSIKAGKNVSVFVSDGPRLIDVPDLSQTTLEKAKSVLADSNLPMGSVDAEYDATVQKGIVTAQQPAAGSKVSRETAVNLTVSKGPPPPAAPTNLTATSTIAGEVDLAWDEVGDATYDVYRDGTKIATELPQTAYSDVDSDQSKPHSYTVSSVNSNGESAQCAPVTASASPDQTTAPADETSSTDPASTPAPLPVAAAPSGSPKQRQFDIRFRVPNKTGSHNVQIEVQDTTGTNIVYDEDRYRGDVVDENVTAFGNKVIFRIFIDGKLMKQQTK